MVKLFIKEWCLFQKPPITARQLAEKTNIPEVSLNRIINGKTWPERDRIEIISSVLGITANDLFMDPSSKDKDNNKLICPNCGHPIEVHIK